MQTIPLDRLIPHPENANVMPERLLARLADHIERTGHYPPLIVRPHPSVSNAFELLDGHHRRIALERLKRPDASCVVWAVDDDEARTLLATLNRLEGADDPHRRASLLERLRETPGVDLLARLPETAERLRKLLALNRPPPAPATPPLPGSRALPLAITFFLTREQHRSLLGRLQPINRDRSAALVRLLDLDESAPESPTQETDS